MKTKINVLAVLACLALLSFTRAENETWTLDNVHSKLTFSVTHLMLSDVVGSFKSVNATITTSKTDFSDAVVEMNAQISTLSTDNDQRDGHIKSADFLDAEKYPDLSFKSTSFKKEKTANTYTVTGNLTLHGVTKPVTLNVIARTGVNPQNNKTIGGFKITGTVNRKDFNVGASIPAAVVSDEISILANGEFVKN